jgi:hypothetical protein
MKSKFRFGNKVSKEAKIVMFVFLLFVLYYYFTKSRLTQTYSTSTLFYIYNFSGESIDVACAVNMKLSPSVGITPFDQTSRFAFVNVVLTPLDGYKYWYNSYSSGPAIPIVPDSTGNYPTIRLVQQGGAPGSHVTTGSYLLITSNTNFNGNTTDASNKPSTVSGNVNPLLIYINNYFHQVFPKDSTNAGYVATSSTTAGQVGNTLGLTRFATGPNNTPPSNIPLYGLGIYTMYNGQICITQRISRNGYLLMDNVFNAFIPLSACSVNSYYANNNKSPMGYIMDPKLMDTQNLNLFPDPLAYIPYSANLQNKNYTLGDIIKIKNTDTQDLTITCNNLVSKPMTSTFTVSTTPQNITIPANSSYKLEVFPNTVTFPNNITVTKPDGSKLVTNTITYDDKNNTPAIPLSADPPGNPPSDTPNIAPVFNPPTSYAYISSI